MAHLNRTYTLSPKDGTLVVPSVADLWLVQDVVTMMGDFSDPTRALAAWRVWTRLKQGKMQMSWKARRYFRAERGSERVEAARQAKNAHQETVRRLKLWNRQSRFVKQGLQVEPQAMAEFLAVTSPATEASRRAFEAHVNRPGAIEPVNAAEWEGEDPDVIAEIDALIDFQSSDEPLFV